MGGAAPSTHGLLVHIPVAFYSERMNFRTRHLLLVLLALPLLQGASKGGELYRYRDDNGQMVVGSHVPPEHVGKGYEVLNERGIVVRVVPRGLTEEERADASLQRELEARAAREEERLRAWDESLLLRYSSVEDIEAARERAVGELRVRLSILRSNRSSLKHQVENYQAQVADMERRGDVPDAARLENIANLQQEIEQTESQIEEREREIREVEAAFARDIERFAQLEEVVELRRRLSARGDS